MYCIFADNRNFYQHSVEPQIKPMLQVPSKRKGPTLLCAHRLLPTRHQTKNAVLSIFDGNEVCVEFIKKRGNPKRDMVCEVLNNLNCLFLKLFMYVLFRYVEYLLTV